jgi:pyruvate dehydrogenase E2 component (dihydrolipoamide acetyltransferase)
VAETVEVRVPNIGDFSDVPVIDVLVKPGDTLAVEDPIVTLESEKATMEVPSPQAGVVQSVTVKVGDKVSEGTALLTLAPAANGAAPAPPQTAAPKAATPRPQTPEPAQAQTIEVRVPNIGDFSDVPVIDVLVKPGDTLAVEDPIVTIESEKATMEVPSPQAGVVQSVSVKVGDKVSEGTPLLTLAPGAPAASAVAAATSLPQAPKAEQPTAEQPKAEVPAPRAADAAPAPREPQAAPASNGTVHASPSIRRFARELGVDLHGVRGGAPHGRISREDVQSYVKRALTSPRASGGGLGLDLPPWPKVDFAKFGPIERVALSRIRKLSGPILHRNWVMIPHVTNNDEADITDLESFRKQLHAEHPGTKITMLAFVIKAAVAALREFPDLNSSLDGDFLILKKYYNIGFAADTPNGLVVPVIKGADVKGVVAVADETAALAAKAREGKLGLADMQGATFTISSLGGIGGTSFTPIINAPEVAILGVSRSAMRPVWDGKAFVPRLMLPLSLSYDHRVIDGALAARFNARLASVLGDLRRAML